MFPAIVDGVATRKDGTLSIKLSANEMKSEQMSSLFALNNNYVSVCLKDNDLTVQDIAGLDLVEMDMMDESKQKSQSSRLRSVLYLLHREQGGDTDFKDYYRDMTDKIIEHYKSKLQPRWNVWNL